MASDQGFNPAGGDPYYLVVLEGGKVAPIKWTRSGAYAVVSHIQGLRAAGEWMSGGALRGFPIGVIRVIPKT